MSARTEAASAPAIRTPDQRLRVFISSTLGELAAERAAAKHAVEALRLTPVMFELGARPHPPQALYRAYLAQSDVFMGVYWERYGWVAPHMAISGLEDEYLLSAGMPRLIYVKRAGGEREPRLTELLARIQGDDSVSYRPFDDAAELQRLVADDLAILLSERFAAPEVAAPATPLLVAPPAPSTALIGREQDVDGLVQTLRRDDVRLVTLTGTGGVGKTRLAIAALDGAASRWPLNRAFFDLSAVRHADEVPAAIATTLGIVAEGRQSPRDAVQARLRAEDALLVLDNFEQVSDAAHLVAALLAACPRLTLLVTSRTVLHLRGEVEWAVRPLAAADGEEQAAIAAAPAVQLLVARIRDVRPGFTVTSANAADVHRLARRLDGLPLALELAAGQLRLLTPGGLLRRLDEHLDLAGAHADLPARQRSLHATLDWSHELLTPRQRSVFARMSVFVGGGDLDAVAAVCDLEGEGDTLEVISHLVECSLLTVADGGAEQPRLRMLETVREYARAQLEQRGEVDATLDRLRTYLTDFVEQADQGMQQRGRAGSWLSRLDAEVDNIKAATEWTLAQGDSSAAARLTSPVWLYWWIRGQASWLALLAERLGGEAEDGAPTQLEVMWLQGGARFMTGRFAEAIPWLREAASLARRQGLDDAVGWALVTLGTCLTREEDYTEARAVLGESVAIFRRLGTPLGVGYAATHLGDIHLLAGDVQLAVATHRECLDIAHDYRHEHLTAQAACHLGFDHLMLGELDAAAGQFEEAGRIFERLPNTEGVLYCLTGLAGVAQRVGDSALAARVIGTVNAVRAELGLAAWPLMAQLESVMTADVRDTLGIDAFNAAATSGATLTPAAALDAALSQVRPGRAES